MSTVRPLTLSEISNSRPGARGAARLSPSTLTRWIITGCPARDGTRVRLKAERCGGRWLVYPADLDEFFAALAADPTPQTPPRTDAQRQRAADRAIAELERMGA